MRVRVVRCNRERESRAQGLTGVKDRLRVRIRRGQWDFAGQSANVENNDVAMVLYMCSIFPWRLYADQVARTGGVRTTQERVFLGKKNAGAGAIWAKPEFLFLGNSCGRLPAGRFGFPMLDTSMLLLLF